MCLALELEQMKPDKDMDKDMENFVRDCATSSTISNPPTFINYHNTEAVPSGSSQLMCRPAQFPRSSQRALAPRQPPPPQEEKPFVNIAGVGAIGRKRTSDSMEDVPPPSRSQTQSQASSRSGQGQVNGNTAMNGQGSAHRVSKF